MKKQNGVTLIELMVTLAVAIVLMTVGVPMFQSMQANNRALAQANSLLTALSLARAEAVSRYSSIAVCARATDSGCGNDWTQGWLVYVDQNNDGAFNGTDTLVRVFGVLEGDPTVTPQSGTNVVRYMFDGTVLSAQNFDVSQNHASSDPRCVVINNAGQARVERNVCL